MNKKINELLIEIRILAEEIKDEILENLCYNEIQENVELKEFYDLMSELEYINDLK
ncbi:MAG: hypothetical protein M0Q88_01210 [Bacilli bacterium]|nr:hypothetical protein [Bacilli bacterium]